jgi:pimeloyl-ACP methyl ester carboxylesterase
MKFGKKIQSSKFLHSLRYLLLSFVIFILGSFPIFTSETVPQAAQKPEIIEKMVNVGKYNLNFVIIKGTGPTILLESGGGLDSSEWIALMPKLAEATDATIVAYDRAGFGKSDLPETKYDLREETDWLWRALSQLGLDKDLILVGHSYGGFLIRFEASEHPDDVKGLVFVDPFTAELVNAVGIERCNNHPMMGKLPFDTLHPENLTKLQKAVVRMVGIPRNLEEKYNLVSKSKVPKGIPVRVITSGQIWLTPDEMRIWRESHVRLVESIKDAKLIVAEQSDHMIPLRQPDLVVSVVSEVAKLVK